jgi:hypothetical protein
MNCNELLKSWNRFRKMKHTFYRLRRDGRAITETEQCAIRVTRKLRKGRR